MTPEELLAEALQMRVEAIPADAAFGRLSQWDSVAHLRLLLLLEEKMGLTLDEALMNSAVSLDNLRAICKSQNGHCNPAWEAMYAAQKQLNKYPHHYLVSYVFRNFPTLKARQACRVLELGCGAGNNIVFLAREGFAVAGIDAAPSGLTTAQSAIREAGLQADLQLGDFTQLPWDNGTFDLIIDRCSLTCVTETALSEALAEAARVLKPGGRFFSMIHSASNPNLIYGHKTGVYTYDDFSAGAFAGHGTVTALDEAGVWAFYAQQLSLTSMKLMEETEYLPEIKPAAALWVIDAEKSA